MTSPERGAHTAGPRRVMGDGVTVAQDRSKYRTHVCKAFEMYGDRANREANARLIAAAPEMLDTIRTELVDVERAIACTPIGSPAETILDDVARRLRAALAAAEGGGR